ncbi:MAG: hypothetical protein RIS92_646 [Verrucomicrobiota bacterium]|jgi:hypothetical protein
MGPLRFERSSTVRIEIPFGVHFKEAPRTARGHWPMGLQARVAEVSV